MQRFSSTPSFFSAPAAGRRLLASFSYMQRIGKGARTRLCFPEQLDGQTVEWAAVRQFELLQEAGNLAIDDLEVSELKRSFQAWSKMRAGGYSVTVLTLGRYVDTPETDDLYILDQKLQEEITRLIHFLYLSEVSEAQSAVQKSALNAGTWHCREAVPHLAQALSERHLFKPHTQTRAEETFFEILERLPASHVLHDIAVGLTLPEASKEKNWIYVAKEEHRAAAFFGALGTTMGTMIHMHMRGHGDRLTPAHAKAQHALACAA